MRAPTDVFPSIRTRVADHLFHLERYATSHNDAHHHRDRQDTAQRDASERARWDASNDDQDGDAAKGTRPCVVPQKQTLRKD